MSIRDRFKAAPAQDYEAQRLSELASNKAPPIAAEYERYAAKRGVGRPASGKVVVSLRLEPEVIAKFRATGPGWQARMNDVLKAAKV